MFESLSDPFSFYQLIGWIPFFLFVISYQILDPRKTIFLWIPAGFLMGIHFYGIGAFVAMGIAWIAMLRDLAAVYGSKLVLRGAVISYLCFAWILFLSIGEAIDDLLVTIGTTFLTFSSFSRDYFWRHRLFAMLHQSFWMAGFVFMGSYAGFATVAFTFGSNIIGIIRYKRRVQVLA